MSVNYTTTLFLKKKRKNISIMFVRLQILWVGLIFFFHRKGENDSISSKGQNPLQPPHTLMKNGWVCLQRQMSHLSVSDKKETTKWSRHGHEQIWSPPPPCRETMTNSCELLLGTHSKSPDASSLSKKWQPSCKQITISWNIQNDIFEGLGISPTSTPKNEWQRIP